MDNDSFLSEAVNNIAPKMVDGGKKLRGPNATYDFIQQVWIETALLKTRALPALLENERQNYQKQIKLLEDIGHKSKFPSKGGTHSIGWSKSYEYKFDFSLTPQIYNYFANVVGPFLDYGKEIWRDTNSKMWKKVKKMIIDGDKLEIAKLQKYITKQLLKESGKKIQGAISGIKAESSGTDETKT